jgi:hypothetical protein
MEANRMNDEQFEEWERYFIFLNVLRESGVTNMFGATTYLAEHFEDDDMSDKQWREVLMCWMQNYNEINRRLDWE